MKTEIHYNKFNISVEIYWDNTHIENSYRIKHRSDMRNILKLIRQETDFDMAIKRLSLNSQIREWRAHNLLYILGIKRKHTKDVDLNNNPWYIRFVYAILSGIYWYI